MSGVEIRVRSDSRPAQRDLARLNKSIESISRTANRVEKAIAAIGTAVTFAFSADALTKASDKFIELENRVALVTGRTQELTKSMDALYNVSIQTRSGIETSVETFNRFGRALQGVEAGELINITKTIQQAVAISGAGTESARAALFQLGQGLASGELRGQELNSVLEQTPRIAQAIADSMGVPIGALRELAAQGQISTAVVFNAVKSQAAVIDQEFQITKGTVGQALTNLFDQFGRVIGQFDKVTLGISSVATFFRDLAVGINENANSISLGIANAFSTVESTTYGLGVVFSGLGAIFGATFGRIIDALPRVILPMRTLSDDVTALATFGFTRLATEIAFVAGSIEAFASDVFGLNFEGTIFRLFQAKSLVEFGRELENIAEVVSAYGNRWYNVSNFIERGIRQTNFALLNTGIYLGIVDQKLIAFRYVSFERFGKVVGVVGDLFRALGRAILSLDSVAYVVTGLLVAFQQIRRTFEGFLNLFNTGIVSVRNRIEGIFENLSFGFVKANTSDILEAFGGQFGQAAALVIKNSDVMSRYWSNLMDSINERTTLLGKTQRAIRNFARTVERWFYWIYDKVIGNSWWTDTMEGVYHKAVENFQKTTGVIKSFLADVSSKFSKVNFKEVILNAKVSFTESNIVESATKIADNLIGRLKSAAKSVASVIADLFKGISDVFPKLAEGFAVAFTGAVLAAFSPALFAKIGIVFGLGLISAIGDNISQVVGKAIVDSNFFASLGAGLGGGIGAFFNAIAQNLPLILTSLFQFAKEFGRALIDEMTGAFGAIPQALSAATFGIFDTIFGAIIASTGFSLLTVGFEKTMKRISGILGVFIGTGRSRGGVVETAIFGRAGFKGSRGRTIAGVLGILTAVTSLTGGFTEGGGFAEAAISGGLLGYYLFGRKGVNFLASAAKETMGQITGTITGSLKDISKSGKSAASGLNIGNILSDFKSGNFEKGLKGATTAFNAFKTNISAGKFDTSFTSSLANLGGKFSEQFKTGKFTSKIENRFQGLGSLMGEKLGKGFGKSKGLVVVSAALLSIVASASQASAATASTGVQVNNIIDTLMDNALEIGYFGLLGLTFFGPKGYVAAFRLITGTIGKLGGLIVGGLTSNVAKSAGSGILNALIFGGKAAGKGGKVNLGPVLGGLTSLIGGVFRTLGSLLLRLVPLIFSGTGLLIGAVGLLGLVLFGEGDGIFAKISNFGSALRSAITGTTKEARRFRKELDSLLKIEKVGEMDLNLKALVDTVDLNSVNEKGFKELKRSLEIANRTFEDNQDKFDELGELTSLEESKNRAAIRRVEEAVNRLNLNDPKAGVFAELTKAFAPENIGGKGFNFINTPINATDTPELIKAFSRASAQDATSLDQVTYLRNLDKYLRDATQGRETPPEQQAVIDSLGGFNLLFDLVEKGIPITIDEKRLSSIGSIVKELQEASNAISTIEPFSAIVGEGSIETQLALIGRLGNELRNTTQFIYEMSQLDFRNSNLEQQFKDLNEQVSLLNSLVPETAQFEPLSESQFFSLSDNSRSDLQKQITGVFDQIKDEFQKKVESDYQDSLGGQLGINAIGTSEFNERVEKLVNKALEDGLTLQDLALYQLDPNQFAQDIANALFTSGKIVEYSEREIEKFATPLKTRVAEAVDEIGEFVPTIDFSGVIDTNQLAQNAAEAEKFIKLVDAFSDNQENILISPEKQAKNTQKLLERLRIDFTDYTNSFALLQGALNIASDPIDEKDLYKKDDKTRQTIQGLTLEILLLKTVVSSLGKDGIQEGEIPILADYLAQIATLTKALEAEINKPQKAGKTIFEKFVGSISNAGFSADLKSASRLSQKAVESLTPYLKKVDNAQKAITNSALKDSAGRAKNLDIIKQSREEIAKIFQTQDVATAQAGLEGLGLDPNLVFESEQALNVAKEIANLNVKLGLTDNSNLEGKKKITNEIEKQTERLELLTQKNKEATEGIKSTFGEALKELIKGGSTIKQFFNKVLDSITNQIINSVVDAFVTSFIRASGLEKTFDDFFAGLGLLGQNTGESIGTDIASSMGDALDKGAKSKGTSWLSSLFGGAEGGLFSMLGGSGSGGGIGSLLNTGLGFFGLPAFFNTGGIVPSTPYSQSGKDSVPAMLTPGELIIPANRVNDFMKGNNSSQQTVVNLSITGDVSRQTRQEIVKMLPTIASGVNAQNKENNYRR
jgi:tape measure domain-containing protein